MSVKVATWVWEKAPVRSGELVVLLKLADCAHDDGGGCYPSQAEVAERCRMSERQVRNHLKSLQERGIIRPTGKIAKGIVVWQILMRDPGIGTGTLVPGDDTELPGTRGSGLPTEPSGEPSTSSPSGEDAARAKAEPLGFEDWLAHHAQATDHSIPAAGTQRRARLAAAFGSITADGFNPDDFIAATRAVTTEWHRERGHDSFETVLRKTEFGAKVARGRAEALKDAERAPMREKYDGMDGAAAPVDPGVFD